MAKLENWDFNHADNDEKLGLVNRQKSAMKLGIVWIDYETKTAEFLNNKSRKGRDLNNTASLNDCDCSDFRFHGKYPRKSFQPCMHIYRLAIEFELMEPKHFSAVRYVRLTDEEKAENKRLRVEAMRRLWSIPREPSQWGSWSSLIHVEDAQQARMRRALEICENEPHTIERNGQYWIVHDYGVSLEGCDCMDFMERQLPCKHMYVVALESGATLEITEEIV